MKHRFSHRYTLLGALGIVVGVCLLAAIVTTTQTPKVVQAITSDLNLARSKYPSITGTALDSCNLCHYPLPAARVPANPYGIAYLRNGRNTAAFGQIESLDSDGDGYSNVSEINALTLPGDAGSHPSAATPQLRLQLRGQPTSLVYPGQVITYVLAYSNTGNVALTGVVLTGTIPLSTTYRSASRPPVVTNGRLRWQIGALPIGQAGQITYTVLVSP
jgi:uncharacterized repeat protein (TIGR01451 family)